MCHKCWLHNSTWAHHGKRLPEYVSFSQVWASAHEGRFWKRRLSKVRRRAWKAEVLYGHRPRGLAGVESTVNWKNW